MSDLCLGTFEAVNLFCPPLNIVILTTLPPPPCQQWLLSLFRSLQFSKRQNGGRRVCPLHSETINTALISINCCVTGYINNNIMLSLISWATNSSITQWTCVGEVIIHSSFSFGTKLWLFWMFAFIQLQVIVTILRTKNNICYPLAQEGLYLLPVRI